jgi:hypothetical protein
LNANGDGTTIRPFGLADGNWLPTGVPSLLNIVAAKPDPLFVAFPPGKVSVEAST